MVNTRRLTIAIDESGLKKQFLAEKLGLSIVTFWRKVKGESEFKLSEVVKLCELLKIRDVNERDRIFFAKPVDYKSTYKE